MNPRRKKRTKTSKWILDLKSASIARPINPEGPGSIVSRKFFQLKHFRSVFFCSVLEEYRPSELGSIIFRSKRTGLKKKFYKREPIREKIFEF